VERTHPSEQQLLTPTGIGRSAIPTLPAELIQATAIEAARDADRVGLFLRERGLLPAPGHTLQLPAEFLLALGAALRLLEWETGGLRVHRDAGLPDAEKALDDAFLNLGAAGGAADRNRHALAPRVVALFADRFAWHGRRELDADVILDDHVDEDALVDALAELLWVARHGGRTSNDSGA